MSHIYDTSLQICKANTEKLNKKPGLSSFGIVFQNAVQMKSETKPVPTTQEFSVVESENNYKFTS